MTKPRVIIGIDRPSFENQRDLALIGLVLGETIHMAQNNLGLARHHATMIANDPLNRPATKERGREILRLIGDYTEELFRIRRLQADPPSPTQLRIHGILDDVVKSDRFRSIRLAKTYELDDDSIVAPERQMVALFEVLTRNAINSMPPRETLTLETSNTEIDGIPAIRVLLHHRWKEDTPNHQTAEVGLLWVRSFMRAYGGELRVVTSDRGVTTEVLLPRIFNLDLVPDETKDE